MTATQTKLPRRSRNELPRDFRLEVAQRKLERRRRAQEALKRCDGATAVMLENKSGMKLIVHRSTYRDYAGQWQLTTIAADGRPWGHTNAPTFKEAILRAVGASRDSYWNEYGYEVTDVA